jgi:TolA-binding protein
MDCKKAETFLVEYLYEELSASKTVELESHLKACDGCTRLLDNWKAIHQGYQESMEAPQTPPFLRQRILSHAKAEMERPPSIADTIFAFLRPALLVPVAVVALFALLFFNQSAKKTEMAQAPVAQPAVLDQTTPSKDSFLKTESKVKASEVTDDERKRETDRDALKPLGYIEPGRKAANEPLAKKESIEGGKNGEFEKLQDEAKQEPPAEQAGGGMAASAPQQPASVFTSKSAGSMAEETQTPAPPATEPASPPLVALRNQAKVTDEKQKGDQLDSPVYNFQQAQENFRQDQNKKGMRFAQIAVDVDSNKKLAADFYNAGLQYQTKKEYAKAIVQYNFVVNNYQAYQKLNDVLFKLGECYAAIGKLEDAEMIFRQLLKSNPTDKVLKARLSEIENQARQKEELRSLGYVDQQ